MSLTFFKVIITQTINQLTKQPTKCTNPLIDRSVGRSENTFALLLEK